MLQSVSNGIGQRRASLINSERHRRSRRDFRQGGWRWSSAVVPGPRRQSQVQVSLAGARCVGVHLHGNHRHRQRRLQQPLTDSLDRPASPPAHRNCISYNHKRSEISNLRRGEWRHLANNGLNTADVLKSGSSPKSDWLVLGPVPKISPKSVHKLLRCSTVSVYVLTAKTHWFRCIIHKRLPIDMKI